MKFFKLSKIRRFIILGLTSLAAILAVALGGFYSVSQNAKKGIEYGGGAEYLVQVQPTTNEQSAQDLATSVADSIRDRIDSLGVGGATVNPENTGDGGANVRITYPALKTQSEKDAMEQLIVDKPILSLTDIYGNVLFDENGHFNTLLKNGVAEFVGTPSHNHESIENFDDSWTQVPIAQGGATATTTNTGAQQVSLNLINGTEYTTAWTQATSYIASLGANNQIVTWLNYEKFIQDAKNNHSSDWNAASKNPYQYAHIGNSATKTGADGKTKTASPLKYFTQDASQFLISTAGVEKALSGKSFVLSGSFTQAETEKLAKQINYGVAKYELKTLSSINVKATYGSSAFEKAMIAGMVVFAMVAIFLIVNYGLLGVLSTISLGLYIYLILQLFTVMRGEYSPETIAALIIGIGMGVDANIITYERLKTEVYRGASLKKAFKKSNKRSFTTIFDANITTLIVAFVLFYFGTKSIVGLSVTLILSILFTLIVMLGFTRFTASMLVGTGLFEERKNLLGLKPKFDNSIQDKINKFDYIKNSKWFVMCSSIVLGAGLLVMAITAGIGGSIKKGFVASQDFTGGTIISATGTDAETAALESDLVTKYNIPASDIYITSNSEEKTSTLDLKTTIVLDVDQLKGNSATTGEDSVKAFDHDKINISNTTTVVADQLVKDAMYAILIAMALIVLYTLVRFRWTFSFAAIVALVHDGLIVTAVFVIARVEFSPVFIAGLLSILGYSINDTIVTFDRIREKLNNSTGELTPVKVKNIANDAIKDTLKRSLLTSITTILAVIILMCFGNATKLSFNLAMLIGLLAGTYSSIFIASYLWVKLEIFRRKRQKAREAKKFWKTDDIEEQTFAGINDFQA